MNLNIYSISATFLQGVVQKSVVRQDKPLVWTLLSGNILSIHRHLEISIFVIIQFTHKYFYIIYLWSPILIIIERSLSLEKQIYSTSLSIFWGSFLKFSYILALLSSFDYTFEQVSNLHSYVQDWIFSFNQSIDVQMLCECYN